jgi:hypothetical protein
MIDLSNRDDHEIAISGVLVDEILAAAPGSPVDTLRNRMVSGSLVLALKRPGESSC